MITFVCAGENGKAFYDASGRLTLWEDKFNCERLAGVHRMALRTDELLPIVLDTRRCK